MQDAQLQPKFVHLRCHSEYSIVDGTVRIEDYVNYASKDQMPAEKSAQRPANDTGSIRVEGFVRIFDPNTKEKFVEQRA